MEIEPKIRFAIEHITFGYGVHYLLQVLLLQFASLFLSFQFSKDLVLEVEKKSLFMIVYSGASVIFVLILLLFVKRMSERTLSPKLHRKSNILVSAAGYFLASGVIVVFGYVILIHATSRGTGIGALDYVFSVMLTALFATLLAVGYHARVVDDQPDRDRIINTISKWEESFSWVEYEEGTEGRKSTREEFGSSLEEISDLLSMAKTKDGRELKDEFESWRSSFEQHSQLSKETIIRGQQNKGNERLEQEHKQLEEIRDQFQVIKGS
ncbi:hypothetical protein [Natrinema gari]|uniref:hypothetical protein n=1 Tax=Natrinema gari TaxID=419186 RepID=UPI00126935FD|nr:hypothetical protein [Natrinema gari]